MMFLQVVICCIGFAMLYYGADWMVKGSSSLARSLGVTPIVIGLTVVALGTSTPEMVVSIVSSIKGSGMIAIGNVVGSNICNLSLVLGAAALLRPIACHPSLARRDLPIMLGVSVYVMILSWNGVLGRIEGVTLVAGPILYLLYSYKIFSKRYVVPGHENPKVPYVRSRLKQIALIVVGIACIIVGAELVVDAAVAIMKVFGVSEKFIGLTIVAFGTSLPELATSVVAVLRNEMDISIGNLVGSNILNLMSVIGLAAIIRPIDISGGFLGSGLIVDYLVMMLIGVAPLLLMRKNHTISRRGGAVLLCGYIVYILYLISGV